LLNLSFFLLTTIPKGQLNMNTLSTRDYHFIVSGDSILTNGNALPYSMNSPHFWQNCELVNQIQDLHLTTLRCLTILQLEEENLSCRLYAQEYHGGELPQGWSWLKREAIAKLESPFPLDDLLCYWDGLKNPKQVEWFQEGFYERIATVFPQALKQIRSWERSAVWHLKGEESLYLKLVPPMFQHETPLCHWLQAHFPEHSVQLVESSIGMLMRDYGVDSLFQRQELAVWEEALRVYGKIQITALAHREDILALGLPVRSLQWIDARIDTFFADDTMLHGGIFPLSEEDISKLRAAIPRLHEACKHLTSYQIPDTLEHGDLWAGQIIAQGENLLITDWSDSAWTHPIFGLVFFLAEIHNDLPNEAEGFEQCKLAYLQQWQDYEPMHRLLEAYKEADLLSPLYTALRYYFDVLPNMSQRWEMENMLGYNLRLLLKAIDAEA
jgi:hypothetical protein